MLRERKLLASAWMLCWIPHAGSAAMHTKNCCLRELLIMLHNSKQQFRFSNVINIQKSPISTDLADNQRKALSFLTQCSKLGGLWRLDVHERTPRPRNSEKTMHHQENVGPEGFCESEES